MLIIWGILALISLSVIVFALFSYAFFWYEAANEDPSLLSGRFSPRRLWLAAKLLGVECLSLLVALISHPFGWLPAANQPPTSGGGTPVILLHGLFQSRACWFLIKWRLRRRGFHNLYALSLPPSKDIEELTERVARKVDELRHALGIDRVHLAGHSMGGIIARNYIQIRGGAGKVERCLLLGAPNHGSKLVPFALSPLGKLVQPDSPFLERLNGAPIPSEVAVTSIYTRHDNIVVPPRNARLEGVPNRVMEGFGHTSLLFHPRSQRAILQVLTGEAP